MSENSINNTVMPWVCPDCGVSRIPPFLKRCSRCCDTELKQAEQSLACEMNKAFYGDDGNTTPEPLIKIAFKRLSNAWDALRGRLDYDY